MSPYGHSPDEEPKDGSLHLTAMVAFVGISLCMLVYNGAASETTPGKPKVAIFESDLKQSLADHVKELERPRRELVLKNASATDGQTTVSNCLTYLASLTNHSLANLRAYSGSVSEYADCFLYRLIPASRGAEYHIGSESNLGKAVSERLVATSLPERIPEEFRRSRRLLDVKADSGSVESKKVTLEKNGKSLEIAILASGDMLGNPIEDLAVKISSGPIVEYGVLTTDNEGTLKFIPGRSFEDNIYGPYQPYDTQHLR